MQFKGTDLIPVESKFKLASTGDVEWTLKKCTLRDRIWMNDRWGANELKRLWLDQNLSCFCEIAFHLLKDKEKIRTFIDKKEGDLGFLDFAELVSDPKDIVTLTTSLCATVGVSQVEIDEVAKDMDAKSKAQAK